jgi:lysophospholipase L1-like esterase
LYKPFTFRGKNALTDGGLEDGLKSRSFVLTRTGRYLLMTDKKKKTIFTIVAAVVLLAIGGTVFFSFTLGYPGRLVNAEKKLDSWRNKGYEKGEILLCGSSFIEYWESSEADLSPLTTYNVGVSSTVVSDWSKWVDKMIAPFAPRAIVLYVGSNDMHGSIGSKEGGKVADEVVALLEKIHERLPETTVYYISVAPTVLREKVWGEAEKCNAAVEKYCGEKDYLNFIDCTPALLNEDGSLKNDIYKSDKLHFNQKGYEIWKSAIAPVLIGDLA